MPENKVGKKTTQLAKTSRYKETRRNDAENSRSSKLYAGEFRLLEERLLNNGANPNVKTEEGTTPLHMAASMRNLPTIA